MSDVTQALQGIASGDPQAQEQLLATRKVVAETMGVSVSTVERHWAYARSSLCQR